MIRFAHQGIVHRIHDRLLRLAANSHQMYLIVNYFRPKTVWCERCDKGYRSSVGTVGDGTQGTNCAADCFQGVVQCYYGSGYDGDIYLFTNRESAPTFRILCDICVYELKQCGDITYAGNILFDSDEKVSISWCKI